MQQPATIPAIHPEGRTVALYSGGVDSYCMAYLCKPDELLYVHMAGAYGAAEWAKLTIPPGVLAPVRSLRFRDLSTFERHDRVIPGRNIILCTLAANYGDRILMGSVDSSTGKDKDAAFAAHMTELLQYTHQPQRWLPQGRDVSVHLPVYHLTKTQLVGMTIAAGHDGDELAAATFSCYNPQDDDHGLHGPSKWRACGVCPPCGRKWMAFTVYGIDVGFDGREAIRTYYEEWRDLRSRNVGRSEQFISDMLHAWHGETLPLPMGLTVVE